MKVFIPAAGKGTRLGILTSEKPKALVEIAGKPMLFHLINKLKDAGFTEFVVNVHHRAAMIEDYLRKHNNFDVDIRISDEKGQLLNTGGGLVKAASLFEGDQPFLVHNVDILTDLDLKAFYDQHIQENNDISLLVQKRETSRYLLFDAQMYLRGWENRSTGEQILHDQSEGLIPYAFGGLHVVNPGIAHVLKPAGEKKFPVIPQYIRNCKALKIKGLRMPYAYWIDMGKPEHLKSAEKYLYNIK